jgi:hypothetical protein
MSASAGFWSTQQLTEFLAAVSACPDEQAAVQAAVERAAEALESEAGALVRSGRLVAVVGFPQGQAPEPALAAVAEGRSNLLDLPGLGGCRTAVATLEESPPGQLLLARSCDEFAPEEINLLRGMGRALTLTLRQLRMLGEERRLRAELQERQRLLEQLSKLQRAIANRAPLQEALDAVTAGAAELLGEDIVGLRLLDSDDRHYTVMVSSCGLGWPSSCGARRPTPASAAGPSPRARWCARTTTPTPPIATCCTSWPPTGCRRRWRRRCARTAASSAP